MNSAARSARNAYRTIAQRRSLASTAASIQMVSATYSTQHPAAPLAGSNNDIDPRGIDYSLFEPETPEYPTTIAPPPAEQDEKTPGAALLLRLIQEKELHSAHQVLLELQELGTDLGDPLPEYAQAALWSLQNGTTKQMLLWISLCPVAKPNKQLTQDQRHVLQTFQKIFTLLLDTYGDNLHALQKAALIAAGKGYWQVLQIALAQVLRYGATGTGSTSTTSTSQQGWHFFSALAKNAMPDVSASALQIRNELTGLYNLGIRTLVLSGRHAEAVDWARQALKERNRPISRLKPFTLKLLFEELLKGGQFSMVRSLQADLRADPDACVSGSLSDLVDTERKMEKEAQIRAEYKVQIKAEGGTELELVMMELIEKGDAVGARDILLEKLMEAIPLKDNPHATRVDAYQHLPSTAVLSDLQELVHGLGTVVITTGLTEGSKHNISTTLTAEEFLRPIRFKLRQVRAGRGLWETAKLFSMVKKQEWSKALTFYSGPTGFRLAVGGISEDLIKLALNKQVATYPDEPIEYSKRWPSTHAVNLALRAIVGCCLDSSTPAATLEKVYSAWKEACFENKGDFTPFPPGHPPDSYTFDPFLRGFARKECGGRQKALEVVRDMAEHRIRPSVAGWTIVLDALAREGWNETTQKLACGMGIRVSGRVEGLKGVPEATIETYTALLRGLTRAIGQEDYLEQAGWVRDDLLSRLSEPPLPPENPDVDFWSSLLNKYNTIPKEPERLIWTNRDLHGDPRTLEMLYNVWYLERKAEEAAETNVF